MISISSSLYKRFVQYIGKVHFLETFNGFHLEMSLLTWYHKKETLKGKVSHLDIRIAGYAAESIVDGPGIRFALFTQGCPHHCEGCHNPHTHSYDGGTVTDTEILYKTIIENPLVKAVTFSGGEPMEQPEPLSLLAQQLKEKGYHIMIYTGYTFEWLLKRAGTDKDIASLLKNTDILVDGKFDINQKSYELSFKGSKNQRILDVQKSLEEARPVEIEL